MNFYFAGAIRGGREKIDTYKKIVKLLKKYGAVLTEHVADSSLTSSGEKLDVQEVYKRDCNWLKESDIMVAEISVPSLGVGYELAFAEFLGKKIICCYDESKNVSAMIRGNDKFELIKYSTEEELLKEIESKLNEIGGF